ncbi:protein-glutamate methylesterase/protein-glutamine glutaminase [Neobacillus thermocopriae]|uniref:protein-glutamate methylesterase/protein-glutamine glutaminase n=1 Tax=Neobacillus thermocopriae TaxID=1215031 RepID=UPI00376FF534
MKKYRILVVDDSAFMRRAICQILESDPHFTVVGIARNGLDAIEKVERLQPDLVTMDIEMPEMNGLAALEHIMKTFPTPIVMLSSYTKEGAKETVKALDLGAVDFFLKDSLLKNQADTKQVKEFLNRLREIIEAKLPKNAYDKRVIETKTSTIFDSNQLQIKRVGKDKRLAYDLVFIGCSTGGPSALKAILPYFPKDFPVPIVVAQHMPSGFTKPLADRFNSLCELHVKEAQNGETILPGNIYIAPSGYQTQFEKRLDGTVQFIVDQEEVSKTMFKPSINISLTSAAPIFAERLLVIILTGMGVDGMEGCGRVKKHRGTVFVEAEESCVVYGMPKAVLEAGYADGQFLLSKMFQQIMAVI